MNKMATTTPPTTGRRPRQQPPLLPSSLMSTGGGDRSHGHSAGRGCPPSYGVTTIGGDISRCRRDGRRGDVVVGAAAAVLDGHTNNNDGSQNNSGGGTAAPRGRVRQRDRDDDAAISSPVVVAAGARAAQNMIDASSSDCSTTTSLENWTQIAKKRWLKTEEILLLLDPRRTPLRLSTTVPKSPPPSGSLFLYDRKRTRYYRNDGHEWVKKGTTANSVMAASLGGATTTTTTTAQNEGGGGEKGGEGSGGSNRNAGGGDASSSDNVASSSSSTANTAAAAPATPPKNQQIREDLVKLRLHGKVCLSGWYAHGAKPHNTTFHRRSYYLSESTPPGTVGRYWALVHYLDTDKAAELLSRERNLLVKSGLHTAVVSSTIGGGGGGRRSGVFMLSSPAIAPLNSSSSRFGGDDGSGGVAMSKGGGRGGGSGGGGTCAAAAAECSSSSSPTTGKASYPGFTVGDGAAEGGTTGIRRGGGKKKKKRGDNSGSVVVVGAAASGAMGTNESKQSGDANGGSGEHQQFQKPKQSTVSSSSSFCCYRVEENGNGAVDSTSVSASAAREATTTTTSAIMKETSTTSTTAAVVSVDTVGSSLAPPPAATAMVDDEFETTPSRRSSQCQPLVIAPSPPAMSDGGGLSSSSLAAGSSTFPSWIDGTLMFHDCVEPDHGVVAPRDIGDVFNDAAEEASAIVQEEGGSHPLTDDGGDADDGYDDATDLSLDDNDDESVLLPSELLPDLVRFSPSRTPWRPQRDTATMGITGAGVGPQPYNSRMTITLGDPLPPLPTDGSSNSCSSYSSGEYRWKRFAAFVDIGVVDASRPSHQAAIAHEDNPTTTMTTTTCTQLVVRRVALSPLSVLDPETVECDVPSPNRISRPGHRSIILVSVSMKESMVEDGAGALCATNGDRQHGDHDMTASSNNKNDNATAAALERYVATCLQRQCNEALEDAAAASSSSLSTTPTPAHQPKRSMRPTFFASPSTPVAYQVDSSFIVSDRPWREVQTLSQLSRYFFEFIATTSATDDDAGEKGNGGIRSAITNEEKKSDDRGFGDVPVNGFVSPLSAGAAAGPSVSLTSPLRPAAAQLGEGWPYHSVPLTSPHDAATVVDVEGGAGISSVTSWLSVPRFEERDVARERNGLSFQEMSCALEDIHGVPFSQSGPHHFSLHGGLRGGILTKDVSEFEFQYLDHCIATQVPGSLKAAFLRAQRERPDLVTREHKALFLASNESKDPAVAAEKYCRYWELRVEIFGEDRAFLPMTLNGALRDDWWALTEVDYCHYLPGVEDKFGRALIFNDGLSRFFPSRHDPSSVARAIWYMFEAATRHARDPSKGVVTVMDLSNVSMANMNMESAKNCYRMFKVFPLIVRAHHYINPPWFADLVTPVLKLTMGKELRQREIMHRGSSIEVSHSLARYGILPEHMPKGSAGGTLQFDVAQWLMLRQVHGM